MLDLNGYRLNVGIILLNKDNKVFWGKRTRGGDSWQFPQGGVMYGETLVETMYRELHEEVGLLPQHVAVIARTYEWLYYNIPNATNRSNGKYKGQKQIWYLLRFLSEDSEINLDAQDPAEFNEWQWLQYWDASKLVVDFKQNVYKDALNELSRYIKL